VNAKEGVIYKLDDEKNEKWSVALNLDDYLQQQNKNIESKYRIVQLLEIKYRESFMFFMRVALFALMKKQVQRKKYTRMNSLRTMRYLYGHL
jgi:hypothetical protein